MIPGGQPDREKADGLDKKKSDGRRPDLLLVILEIVDTQQIPVCLLQTDPAPFRHPPSPNGESQKHGGQRTQYDDRAR